MKGDFIMETPKNEIQKIDKLISLLQEQISKPKESPISLFSINSAISALVPKVKSAVSEIKELDKTLIEISKSSNITKNELKQLGISAYDTANNYGKTADNYLSSIKNISQSGTYGKKSEAMAEQSLLAQAAGNMSQEIADKYIIATNAAYKFNGVSEKINAVLDGQNSISIKNHIAFENIATAMENAASAASGYNVKVEDLSAIIGTIEAITGSGGRETGSGIKFILDSLQNINSDKITNTLNKANASMTEMANGTEKLRNPVSILKDLALTFNNLDNSNPLKTDILNNIAGTNHSEKLKALLQNIDIFDKMLYDYSNGTGSALEEANKNAETLAGNLNTLSNNWTGLINSVINTDELKTGINLLNSLVQGTSKLLDITGSFGITGLGAGLLAGIKNVGRDKMFSPILLLF